MALTKVTSDVLADEFFTRATAPAQITTPATKEVDFTAAAVIPFSTSAAITLNFTNHKPGMVKNVIITDVGGSSSLAYDISDTVKVLNGSYSATAGAVNFIQVVCVNTNTFYVTISQEPTS